MIPRDYAVAPYQRTWEIRPEINNPVTEFFHKTEMNDKRRGLVGFLLVSREVILQRSLLSFVFVVTCCNTVVFIHCVNNVACESIRRFIVEELNVVENILKFH